MAWRIAKSLDKLRSQINAKYPKRDKSSDGVIGDEAHASRSSDHNPWVKDGKTGVVTGMDITNDPKNGMASNDLAEALLASRDPRIKYIISNARIGSGDAGPSPWVWRKYSGANAHRHHVHISVKPEKPAYDSVKPWSFEGKAVKFVEPVATIEDPPEEPDAVSPADKTVIAARTAAGAAAATPVVGTVAQSLIGSTSDIADQVTTVADQSGHVIAATKQVISVAKPGFWNTVLHVVTSPAFLVGVIVVIAAAWAFVWFWQRTHREGN